YRLSKERQQVLDVLRKAGRPMTPTALAPLLGKTPGATKKLLWSMAGEGQAIALGDGTYLPSSNPGNRSNSSNRGNRSNPQVTERYRDGDEDGNRVPDTHVIFPP